MEFAKILLHIDLAAILLKSFCAMPMKEQTGAVWWEPPFCEREREKCRCLE